MILKLRSNRNRGLVRLALLLAGSVTTLFGLPACGQVLELKLVDLQGDQIIRIDAKGSVFDATDKKVAIVDDREGSFTFVKPHALTQKIVFKNDPSLQRNQDRYTVKIGDGFVFEVKPDGNVLLDGKPWGRVVGYAQNETQKDRFMAAIVAFPFLEDNHAVLLPHYVKNAEADRAIKKNPKIWIPANDEIYVDDEQISKADFNSKLDDEIEKFLKRSAEASKIIYVASSILVDWGTVVRVINSAREKGVDRAGLVVLGNGDAKNRFLVQIPPLRDPNEDISKLKPSGLLLFITVPRYGEEIKLAEGASTDGYLPIDSYGISTIESQRTLSDTSALTQALAQIFQKRKEQHVYKPGTETRVDLPEDERIEKTVLIKAYRACPYGDVIKIIDVVKGTGAGPIVLQVDDLPN
jgi:biopolymer transport protein ExbD